MEPPIFAVCSADPGVTEFLGAGIDCRLFSFGEAEEGALKPYAVWGLITGSPENYLAGRPDADGFTLQVDVYAATGGAVAAVTKALCAAIEPHAYVVRWGATDRDPKTKDRHRSFDVDWIVRR
ncbi:MULTISPECIES: DUF3168 domain-containing protein [Pseudomonas chlororaphis group]|uniref:tail completion protein gp17 n=1 Tax=Pseudomonas chlororaphis group TaxID=136842 RepID=UPI0020980906|nr:MULTISPECIES: DUF3168 domain-containing protein [Pseudomonas chlororaphis group]MCO7575349.1 DUF3168 domain-containing protein [Pseudomonas protegens]MCO7582548.1 DUF3168 domain-containing protein [Pseudomonas chlororaphis]MCO7599273.1 DUF3168 domain-containing protein [Pseudomonas chlororaphis]